jgi:hypothetical protein
MMFSKNDLLNELKSKISFEGFTPSIEGNGVWWKKKLTDRTLKVYIAFSDRANGFHLDYPFSTISFDKVEDIMVTLNMPTNYIHDNYTCRLIYSESTKESKLLDFSISSTDDFAVAIELLTTFIEESLHFFESYNNFNKVLETLDSLEVKMAVLFLGQPLPLRKMVLLYYSNFEEFTLYSEKVKASCLTTNNALLNTVNELIKNLELTRQN